MKVTALKVTPRTKGEGSWETDYLDLWVDAWHGMENYVKIFSTLGETGRKIVKAMQLDIGA